MKTLKMLLVAFAITMSSTTYANSPEAGRTSGVSGEIQKMISESDLTIEENFTVTVIFKVNEDKKIEIRSISSPNEEVNEFLRKRLENQKLYGALWSCDKIYELPVKVESRR